MLDQILFIHLTYQTKRLQEMDKRDLLFEISQRERIIEKEKIAIRIAKNNYISEHKILNEGDVIQNPMSEKYEVVGDPEFALNIDGEYDILYPCIKLRKNGLKNKVKRDGSTYSSYHRMIPQSGIEKLIYTLCER